MQLTTERFTLRSLNSQELDPEYFEWLKDPEIIQFLTIRGKDFSLDDAKRYVDSHVAPHEFFFGIFENSDLMIGTHSFRYSRDTNRCALGGMIGNKEYWGKKVILETREELLRYTFEETNCIKVEAGCYSRNLSAVFNFVKQGWTKEGILRAHRTVSGISEDLILFGMLRREWNGIR